MLRACSIASGSKGNCLFVQSEQANLIVDAGINLQRLEKSLKLFGISCGQLDGVLITHTHSDHISGVKSLCKKYGVPIYCHSEIVHDIGKLTDKTDSKAFEFEQEFKIKDIDVHPFLVEHDVHCQGYSFVSNSKKLSIATDMGQATDVVFQAMQGSNMIFVESNYDTDLLNNSSYPYHLKKRILSNKGHLSNDACSQFVSTMIQNGTRDFVLCHLSQSNNYLERAFTSMISNLSQEGITFGKDCSIEIAEQDRLSSLYQV